MGGKTMHVPVAGLAFGAAALAAIVVASAGAATIRGTARNDVLRGTAKADKLYGNGGNDKLFGLGGNDVLSGGPGADRLVCGAGRDTAIADVRDTIAADCETVQGLPKPALAVSGDSVAEGDAGNQAAFEVTLASPVPVRVSIRYATANGTATAGSDYTATSGTLVFGPGQTSKSVVVPILGDDTFEPDETFTLTISNPVNATLGTATATGTITNDDAATATPGHYNGSVAGSGNIDFDVAADGHTVSQLSILYYISCDNGAAGLDRLTLIGTATIRPDLSFEITGEDEGFSADIKGTFVSGATTASGTLQVHLSFSGGVSCDTGLENWTATRT